MKWLVTLSAGTETARLKQLLGAVGSSLEPDAAMIPVDGDVVVEVNGPADLPKRIKGEPEVKAVHPSSEMTYY